VLSFNKQIEIWLKRPLEERIKIATKRKPDSDTNPEITEVVESPEYLKAFGNEEINQR
jgi:hypothetical protein